MNGKDTDAKIDELAQMVARGFSEVHKEIGELREELRGEIEDTKKELTGQIQALDKHLIMFRKDHDELATRVKDLELTA